MTILNRVKKLEAKVTAKSNYQIGPRDRVIHFCYRNGDQADYDRKKEECLAEFQKKYGPNAPMDNILIVAIRKFD